MKKILVYLLSKIPFVSHLVVESVEEVVSDFKKIITKLEDVASKNIKKAEDYLKKADLAKEMSDLKNAEANKARIIQENLRKIFGE